MSTSPETISIAPVDDALREYLRAIWSQPQQVEFRAAVLRDPSHVAFLTRGGADPLPEVAPEDGNSQGD